MLVYGALFLNILRFFGFGAEAALDARYPAHWGRPVPREAAASWEVLPQDAGPGEVILTKRNELGILSNFAATPFTYRGKRYASIEGFWQFMKYPEGPDDPRATFPGIHWDYTRDEVAAMTGFEAKRAGDKAGENMRRIGINWISFEGERIAYKDEGRQRHYQLIEDVTREKVRAHTNVRDLLLSTGDLVLRPDHNQESDATPAYRYFDIYMKIRGELQNESIGTAKR